MTLDVFTAKSKKNSMRQKKVKDEETRASNFSSAVRLAKRRRAMFAPSVFGIDGSSTPAVKSWGYQSSFSLRKPASSEPPDKLKSREEALKNGNEGLIIRCGNVAAEQQKRTSLSSPCFSSSSTSWMGKSCNTTHREAFKQGTGGLTRSLSLPDVTIKKINLNKRPKGKIATNQERDCFTRFSEVLQNKRDLTYASDYIQRETNRILNVSVCKTKLGFQDGEEVVSNVFQENEFEKNKAIKHDSCFQSTQLSRNDPDFYTASLRVRKIDIKLPFLGQASELK